MGVLSAVFPESVAFPHLKRQELDIFDAGTEDGRQLFLHVPYSRIPHINY